MRTAWGKDLLRLSLIRFPPSYSIRVQSTTTLEPASTYVSPLRRKIESIVDSYEEFIGIKAVKEAQSQVMEWEEKLSDAQMIRREKQAELKSVQSRLKEIHFDLDRTSRGEDKYLALLTEEHKTIKQERELLDKFEQYETAEREAFHRLSTKVRDSHEKERERVEKTKWWGVTASLVGALLGIAGSSIGNELRMRKLREMLPGTADLKSVVSEAEKQHESLRELLTALQLAMQLPQSTDKLAMKEEGISEQRLLEAIKADNAVLTAQIAELSKKIRLEQAIADPEAVVYVGSDMERLLDETEKKLESKMKLQTLLSVVVLYSAIGLTIPFVYALFRGG